jgi:hypothetical protein
VFPAPDAHAGRSVAPAKPARLAWLILGFVLALAGCGATGFDPKVLAAAHTAFDEVSRADAAPGPHFADSLKTAQGRDQIAQVRFVMPDEAPQRRTPLGVTQKGDGDDRQITVTEDYDYGDEAALVVTTLSWPEGASDWRLTGFRFQVATLKELAAVNDFTLRGKSLLQDLFLLLVVLSPLSMIAALATVIRARGLRYKTLWAIVCFVGLFSVRMNWTSGAISVFWLMVPLVGAGVSRAPSHFAPWMLTMTLPVGALLVLTGVLANPARARSEPAPGAIGS